MRLFALLLATALLVPVVAQTAPSPELEQQVLEVLKRNPQIVLEIVQKNPQGLIDAIRAYQTQSARNQQKAEWQRYLASPVSVDISSAPTLGAAEAPLTLVEFSDFQCPYCAKSQSVIKTLLEKYKGQIRLAFINLPLGFHENARPAALAAWAAHQQGKFFEYHDQLFAQQDNLTNERFIKIAKDLKLDLAKFNKDRSSPQAAAQIAADFKQAETVGAQGTPTFVLNGVVIRGALPIEEFEEAIQLVQSKKTTPTS